jgi:hypothetical protein
MKRYESLELLGRVLREYAAVRFCVSRSMAAIDAGNILFIPPDADFRKRDIRTAAHRLEMTYALRLFAHFEGILRDYWKSVKKKHSRIQMEVLINSVGTRRQINAKVISDVHEVRILRNAIAHGTPATAALGIAQCNSRLAAFLAYLPKEWS